MITNNKNYNDEGMSASTISHKLIFISPESTATGQSGAQVNIITFILKLFLSFSSSTICLIIGSWTPTVYSTFRLVLYWIPTNYRTITDKTFPKTEQNHAKAIDAIKFSVCWSLFNTNFVIMTPAII